MLHAKTSSPTKKTLPYWIPLIVLTALFTAMFGIMPPLRDDQWFMSFATAFLENPSISNFIDGFREQVVFRYNFDNARIPNILGTVWVVLPRWFMVGVLGASFAFAVYLGARLSQTWRSSAVGFSVLIFGIVIALPWFDDMFTVMFAMNYLVPSALTAYAALVFLRPVPPHTAWAFALALVVGLWHEAFAATMLAGVVFTAIVIPSYRRPATAAMAAALIAAIIFLASVPGTGTRIGSFHPERFIKLHLGVLTGLPFYLFAISALTLWARKTTRRHLITPQFVFIFGACGGAWAVWRFFLTDYRDSWPMIYVSSIGLAYIVGKIFATRAKPVWAAYAVLITASFVQPVLSVPWFIKMRQEVMTANEAVMAAGEDSVVFTPVTTPFTAPWYTMGRPSFEIYKSGGFPFYNAIPEQLKDFSPENAVHIGISENVYFHKGCIVLEGTRTDIHSAKCTLYFDGKPYATECFGTNFTTPAGNFTYILPLHSFQKAKLHHLSGFDLN